MPVNLDRTPDCPVCGAGEWTARAIIWPELAAQWQLSEDEVAYVDHQQGSACAQCGTSLRSAALADAVRREFDWPDTFGTMFARRPALATLEINEAGTLTPLLTAWPGHVLASYPEIDMHALPYPDESFDLVVHSDTLEHVDDPLMALVECRRVLRQGGVLIYTIPLIVDRMSRRRDDLPASYHGSEGGREYLVVTEYGSDFWTEPIRAGFASVSVIPFDFPAANAIVARR